MAKTQQPPQAESAALKVAVETKSIALAIHADAMAKMQAAKPTDDFKGGDLMIPWLRLVQTSSGYMKRNDEEFLPEAREGDIIDTLSKRLRATAQVILCKYETHYTEWAPGGGKLIKQWFTDPSGYDAAGSDWGIRKTADGNEISPNATYFVLLLDPDTGAADPMIWSLGGTQVKKAKRINSLARMDLIGADGLPFIPPIYARIFDLSSRGESGNDKSWAGWVAEPGGLVLGNAKFGAIWWAKAEAFREQIEKGNVRPQAVMERAEASEDDEPVGTRTTRAAVDGALHASGEKVDSRDIPF